MNKEKQREMLKSSEFESFINEFNFTTHGGKRMSLDEFIMRKIDELEEPVYKTEDGFEVKEGDVSYYIDGHTIDKWVISPNNINQLKFFKLKENAENFLIENAEVLSYKEIMDCIVQHILSTRSTHDTRDYLKQKIRQKLGL